MDVAGSMNCEILTAMKTVANRMARIATWDGMGRLKYPAVRMSSVPLETSW